MAEELEALWGKFSLTEEEQDGLEVAEEDVEEITAKGSHCLVGKLISDRFIGKRIIRAKLIRGWRPTGSLEFKVLGENTFLMDFEHEWDKIRVMEGRPWIFEGQLFSVAEYDGVTPPSEMNFDTAAFWVRMYKLPLSCMGREMGFKLGAIIGVVEDVDTDDDGIGWGEFLRVKVQVNVLKPLPRGRILKLKNKTLWIPFQYEKVPKFCFHCGVIRHGVGGCVNEELRWKHGKPKEPEYGPWLRAGSPKRRSENRRGNYGEDEFFHEEDSFHGSASESRPATFRPARVSTSDSNGRQKRKETRSEEGGISLNSANFPGAVAGVFPGGQRDHLMQDIPEKETHGDQGNLRKVSVTSQCGKNVGQKGENCGEKMRLNETNRQAEKGMLDTDGNYGLKTHQATSEGFYGDAVFSPTKENIGPYSHVGGDHLSPRVENGLVGPRSVPIRSWKKRARAKQGDATERADRTPTLGKRHADDDGNPEKNEKEKKKGKKVMEGERNAEFMMAVAGAQPRQEP
ncbi:uncharacterized protein LOC132189616 [Corylus avellana]|uniref:uncharacterized protein LOC132189616 n=1 Tax=Corylus avellana TaxID=13451 RepID=UPI00286D4B87|nr:uncharacterized protein LOC132189616 [Corylus avellana]